MANPDILFRGIPRGPTRGYTVQVLAATKPSKVVIPCTGSFSLAEISRQAGVASDKIVCGDISLYSTALGNAIAGNDWRLEVKGDFSELAEPYMVDPVSKASFVLFILRLLQYKKKSEKIHHLDYQRELLANVEEYIGQIKSQIREMAIGLSNLDYQSRDMWETLEAYRNDEGAVLLVNPPRYTGGYKRMFDGVEAVFEWDEPPAEQFTEKDYARLMALLGESQAMTLMYYATPMDDPSPLWGEPWKAVFADRPGNKRLASVNWIISNRDAIPVEVNRAKIKEGRPKYALFRGGLASDSQLRAVSLSREVGDYYRDLFIHRLPGSFAEQYVGLLLDGYLFGVVGFQAKNYRSGGGWKQGNLFRDSIGMVFAFTVSHQVYKRLHKLTLMCAVSQWLHDVTYGAYPWYVLRGPPKRIQTVMLTKHPENKTARGVLKMAHRERQGDGSYKLSYFGEILTRTEEETLQEWLKKYGAQKK